MSVRYLTICLWIILSNNFENSHKFAIGLVSDGERGMLILDNGLRYDLLHLAGKTEFSIQKLKIDGSMCASDRDSSLIVDAEIKSGPVECVLATDDKMSWWTSMGSVCVNSSCKIMWCDKLIALSKSACVHGFALDVIET